MLSRTVVVTGASRGLGLELVKQLVKNPEKHPNRNPSHVVATCRNPDNAPELMELAAEEKDRLFVKARNVAFGGECSLELADRPFQIGKSAWRLVLKPVI